MSKTIILGVTGTGMTYADLPFIKKRLNKKFLKEADKGKGVSSD